MKYFVSLFTAILFVSTACAQGGTDSHFNAGIGVSGWGIPIYLGYDAPIAKDINLGGEISFRSKTENFSGFGNKYKYKHTVIVLGVEGTYYFDRVLEIPEEFDFYGGLGLYYLIWNTTYDGPGEAINYSGNGGDNINFSILVGGRYYWNPKWGINLELGGGNALSGATIGLSMKM